jgi:hypothetical protein
MMYRVTPIFLLTVVLTLFLLVGSAVATELRWDPPREGTVVRATATQLVIAARTWEVQLGKTYRYRLAANAIVTCDGMPCNLEDLKPGQRVRVTALVAGRSSMASRVEALDEQSTYPVAIARAR